jgi:hypothetical protein
MLSKEQRFKHDNPFNVTNKSPGPGGYNLQNKSSLTQSNSKHSFDEVQVTRKNQFGSTYDKYKNVYYREVSKDFQNREGPGPGAYVTNVKAPNKKQYSFSKDDRKLAYEKFISPTPSDKYYESKQDKSQVVNLGTKFSKSRRDFDFSKCKLNIFMYYSLIPKRIDYLQRIILVGSHYNKVH